MRGLAPSRLPSSFPRPPSAIIALIRCSLAVAAALRVSSCTVCVSASSRCVSAVARHARLPPDVFWRPPALFRFPARCCSSAFTSVFSLTTFVSCSAVRVSAALAASSALRLFSSRLARDLRRFAGSPWPHGVPTPAGRSPRGGCACGRPRSSPRVLPGQCGLVPRGVSVLPLPTPSACVRAKSPCDSTRHLLAQPENSTPRTRSSARRSRSSAVGGL